MPTDRPNILIMMTDHQRWDTVLKDDPCITPNMDKFLDESINFTHTYCPMAHCCPARATFWSGLYPSRTGVWNNVNNTYAINRGPHEYVRMFSQDLNEAGYDMFYAGKWHVSAWDHQTPRAYGWREAWEYKGNIQDPWPKWERIRETAEDTGDPDAKIKVDGYHDHFLYGADENKGKGDEHTMQLGIDELPKLVNGDKPWCMYLGWNEPHAPYTIPQRYLDMYDPDEVELPPSFNDEMSDKPDYYQKLRKNVFDQLGEKGTKEAIRHFRAVCTHIDEMFGKVLKALDETGQAENTIVLFCSDHGDYVGDHGLFHKQVPAFEGAYRVPAVIRWPAGIKNPGREVDSFISLADFAPTFLEAAGVETDQYFSGRSLVPFFNDEVPENWRDMMYMQCEGTEQMFTQRQVLTHKHKYVYNGFGRDELYDLQKDPHEMVNLEADPAYNEIKRDLVKRMWRCGYNEQDRLGETQYIMVNTAPWGPKEGFRDPEGKAIPTAIPKGKEYDPDVMKNYDYSKRGF